MFAFFLLCLNLGMLIPLALFHKIKMGGGSTKCLGPFLGGLSDEPKHNQLLVQNWFFLRFICKEFFVQEVHMVWEGTKMCIFPKNVDKENPLVGSKCRYVLEKKNYVFFIYWI